MERLTQRGLRVCALRAVALIASLVAAGLVFAVSGSSMATASTTCGGGDARTAVISLFPPNAELPVGASATFQAVVWKVAPIALAGRRVSFKVVCGPNQGEAAGQPTAVHESSGSGTPSAYFTDTDTKGAGQDLIQASTTTGGRMTSATVTVDWVPPVDCGEPLKNLGYLLALQCDIKKAKRLVEPMVRTAFEMVACVKGVATFLEPAAEIPSLVGDANLGDLGGLSTHTSLGRFVSDLARFKKQGIISFDQLKSLLEDAHDLSGFLRNAANLLKTIASHSTAVSTLALDIANLTGVSSCVSLLSKIVSFPATTTGVTMTSPGTQTSATGSPVSLQIHATDGDRGPLAYTASGLPAGLSINHTTGLISGTPITIGTSSVTITATGPGGASGTESFTWTIAPASLGSTATQVSAGGASACVVLASGKVACWGDNRYGALGDGSTDGSATCDDYPCELSPVLVSGLNGATQVAVGAVSACALLKDHQVACWGDNQFGELGNGANQGTDSCAEGPDSCSTTPVPVQTISTAVAVSVGRDDACAILAGGGIDCWGTNPYGELGNGTTTGSDAPVPVSGINNAQALSAGTDYACALLAGGQIQCWGDGNLTPMTVSDLPDATTVSAGTATCATVSDGSAYCWGDNGHDELGAAVNPDEGYSATPVGIVDIANASSLTSGGWGNVCARFQGGSVECWGDDEYGELGNGNTGGMSQSPVFVTGLTDTTAISAGGDYNCALLSTGAVKCWGNNEVGQLGDGTTSDTNLPGLVNGL